jgi:hypothetical protein
MRQVKLVFGLVFLPEAARCRGRGSFRHRATFGTLKQGRGRAPFPRVSNGGLSALLYEHTRVQSQVGGTAIAQCAGEYSANYDDDEVVG